MKLLVIDIQKGITDSRLFNFEAFIDDTIRIIKAARDNQIAVSYTHLGDPHWLRHPVQGMGWLIDHVEAWMRKRFRIREDRDADIRKKQVTGTFTVVIVITVSLLVAAGILYGCNRIHHTLYLVVAIWMSY